MDRIRDDLKQPFSELSIALEDDEWTRVVSTSRDLPGEGVPGWYGAFYGRLILALGPDEIRHASTEADPKGQVFTAVIFTDHRRIHISLDVSKGDDPEVAISVLARRPLLEIVLEAAPNIGDRATFYTWPQGSRFALRYVDREVKIISRHTNDDGRARFLSFVDSLRADLSHPRP